MAYWSPHIDFQRGGTAYVGHGLIASWSKRVTPTPLSSWASPTSVLPTRRFALTCKDFETPLGVVSPPDRAYVDRIAFARRPPTWTTSSRTATTEHSIEFQVVFLQYVLGGQREFSIVPILVGSFPRPDGTGRRSDR